MQEVGRDISFYNKLPQILAVFTATVTTISDGMQYGWSSPAIPILQSPDSPVKITESDVAWLESIYMIGGFAGLPVTIFCVDKLGRKFAILLAALQNLIAWILIGSATNVNVVLFARFLSGLAGDVAFVATPMYIAEIADKSIRGLLASMIYIMMLIGIVVIYSVAPFVSIAVSSAVGGAFVVFQLLTFHFMPETPYYLLLKGKTERAKKSLQWFRGNENIEKELEDISSAIARQKTESGRLIDLVLVPSNRKAFIIMSVLNCAQQFSGISVILMNFHTILGDAEAIISAKMAAILFSIMMLVACSIAATLIDRVGRKILLTTSSILTGSSLAILGAYFAAKDLSHCDVSHINWLPVVAIMVYAIVFKYGLGMVPIVMTAELFPTSVKAFGMTFADMMYITFAIASIYLYQVTAVAYGMHAPLFVFAICCFITAFFGIFFIPETKGKTLEEIQFILKGKHHERDSSFEVEDDQSTESQCLKAKESDSTDYKTFVTNESGIRKITSTPDSDVEKQSLLNNIQ